jgi:hypothetical protein
MWVSAVELATWGLKAVENALSCGHHSFNLQFFGKLDFRAIPDGLLITSQHHGSERRVVVDPTELIAAWRAFAEQVRHDLVERIPLLTTHLSYGRWFSGGIDWFH